MIFGKRIFITSFGLLHVKAEYSCLKSIINSPYNKLSFIYDNDDLFNNIFETFLQTTSTEIISQSIIHYKHVSILRNLELNNVYIVITTDKESFKDILLKMHSSSSYNSTCITIVIHNLTAQFDVTNNATEYIFQKLWQLNIMDVLVIDTSNKNIVHTFKPITHDKNGKPTALYLGECASLEIDPSNFQEKNQKYNCTVKITPKVVTYYIDNTTNLDENKGFEAMVLRMTLKMLHLKGEFLPFQEDIGGISYENDTYTHRGMMQQVFRKDADLLLSYMRLITTYGHIQNLYPAFAIQLSFMVPIAKPIAMWKNIIFIFQNKTWILLFFTLVITIYTRYSIMRYSYFDQIETPMESILYILQNCINTVYKQPKSNGLPMIILFVFFTFGSLLIVTYYQSQLSSFMSKPLYKNQITNLEGLAKSDVIFGGFSLHREMFQAEPNIYKKWIVCGVSEMCVKYFESKSITEFAVFDDIRRAPTMFPKHVPLLSDGGILYIAPIVSKGSPFEKRYKEVVMQLNESGFILMLEKRKNQERRQIKRDENTNKTLTFEDLQLSFFILCSGLFLAVVIYILELFYIHLRSVFFI